MISSAPTEKLLFQLGFARNLAEDEIKRQADGLKGKIPAGVNGRIEYFTKQLNTQKRHHEHIKVETVQWYETQPCLSITFFSQRIH